MRIGVIDVGNTRTKRALFDGRRLGPLKGKVDLWIGTRVGRGSVPRGTLLIGRDFSPLVRNRARRPEQVGTDRLAQASAAWERARGACVVVALGTAITIDAVGRSGEFRGGLIAPGLRTMARSLKEHTAKLPEVDPVRRRSALGKTTRGAIESGISLAAEGLIRTALRQHAGRVFGTGGDAPLFRDLFDEVVPELSLEGIVCSYLATVQSNGRWRPSRSS